MKSNIINKLSSYFIASALLVLGACNNETTEVITPNHSVIKVSQSGNDNIINLNQSIDFADVSQGVVSRQWSFPEGEVVTVDGDLTEAQVRGTFHQAGTWEVTLNQQFNGEAYVDSDTVTSGSSIDTVITVTVMPAVEVSSLTAHLLLADNQLGDELSLDVSEPTEIPFGSIVRFTYSATGSPSQIEGNLGGAQLEGNDPENQTFDLKFVTLDKVYSIAPILVRPQPESRDSLATIQNFVKCVRSDEPVTLDKISNNDDKDVTLTFSRGLNPATVNADNFSISITTASGDILTPTIASAHLDANDASIVVLEMDNNQVYSDDEITVTYTAGALETADAAIVDAFTDLPLVINNPNLLEAGGFDYSFESGTVNWNAGQPSWLGGDFTNALEKSTERSTDGNSSLKISVDPYNGSGPWGNGTVVSAFENGSKHTFPFTPTNGETVKIVLDAYLESNGGAFDDRIPNVFDTNMRVYLDWGAAGSEYDAHALGGSQTGEWKELEDVVTISLPDNAPFGISLKIAQTGTENFTVFVDNIRVYRWFPRPLD